jgi:hypothetical protein
MRYIECRMVTKVDVLVLVVELAAATAGVEATT